MNLQEHLSNKAFWDVDMSRLDPQQHATFIIEKVFEYGSWHDMLCIARYYGQEKLKEVAMNSSFFFPDTISFLSLIFNIPKEKMACFTSKPYRQDVFDSSGN